jgi:hypothetical protein
MGTEDSQTQTRHCELQKAHPTAGDTIKMSFDVAEEGLRVVPRLLLHPHFLRGVNL